MNLSTNKYYLILLITLFTSLGIAVLLTYMNFEMAAKFVPMLTGLIVTLLFFHIFSQRIERFEKEQDWKKLRIALESRLFSIFQELVILCDVTMVLEEEQTNEAWKALWNKQLNSLVREVKLSMLDELWENVELRSSYSSLLSNERSVLIEDRRKYESQLSSRQKHLFVFIENSLGNMSLHLVLTMAKTKIAYGKIISDLIMNIMREISELKDSGIDIFSERATSQKGKTKTKAR